MSVSPVSDSIFQSPRLYDTIRCWRYFLTPATLQQAATRFDGYPAFVRRKQGFFGSLYATWCLFSWATTHLLSFCVTIILALTIYPYLSILIAIDFNSSLRIYRIICIIEHKCNMTIYLRWCQIIASFIFCFRT